MNHSNDIPVFLLIVGLGVALYSAIDENAVLFAVGCLLAVIGWREIAASGDNNQSF